MNAFNGKITNLMYSPSVWTARQAKKYMFKDLSKREHKKFKTKCWNRRNGFEWQYENGRLVRVVYVLSDGTAYPQERRYAE
jgi:hypothetical protein